MFEFKVYLVIFFLTLALLVIGTKAGPQCQDIKSNDKLDCDADQPSSQKACEDRGCCWRPAQTVLVDKPGLGVPWCYYPTNYEGYQVDRIDDYPLRTVVTLKRKISSGFRNDSQTVFLNIVHINQNSLRIKFSDPNQRRYEVQLPELNIKPDKTIPNPLYKVNVDRNGLLSVVRSRTSKPVFTTNLKQLVFSDQFLQLSSDLPSDSVYGLGEHKDTFRKSANKWTRYTFFNRGLPPRENLNLYSSHPFYLTVEDKDGHSDGVFLLNSNAMDVILQPKPAITWRTIGGVLDFFIFMGPEPKEVVKQYTSLIGFPELPPYWAFGFQLCKFDYKGLDGMMAVYNRTRKANIPYDVQWMDIDALDGRKTFTYDKKNFAKLPDFISDLHKVGMKFIPIVEIGIAAKEKAGTYPAYDLGKELDIFVKNSTGQDIIGHVWPGDTVFPDYTDPKSWVYWTKVFADYKKSIDFDGAWIDMNDPSSDYDGSSLGCPNTTLENPAYVPQADDAPLRKNTLCMNARHHDGLHYDIHNLYATYEAKATNIALKEVLNKRPVIISRSSSPGHGKYAGHWDGDIFSTWDHLKWTIPSILNFNLFGIPLAGADICGFNGNTTPELCARWHALGAFYTFSRNHNGDQSIPQDPAVLGPDVIAATKSAFEWKYSLLPYLYTLFFRAHTEGDSVVRPLFFEFPKDTNSYAIESQFMWGSALMVVPVLEEKATQVNAYFPPGLWYDLKTHSHFESSVGQTVKLDCPITDIKLFVRSGHVLVTQPPKVTTEETRKGDFELLVALDSEGTASGSLYWDSGDGLDTLLTEQFDIIAFEAKNNIVKSVAKVNGFDISKQHLTKAVILGVKSQPNSVKVNGVSVKDFKYDKALNQLSVNGIALNLMINNTIEWK